MARLGRRLERLERSRRETGSSLDSPEWVRDEAERINASRREGEDPIFEIIGGKVFTLDGCPVTTYHQTGAEMFYQQALAWFEAGTEERLIFDEDAEAFYTPEGELVVSRTHFHLPAMLAESRGEGTS